MTSTARNLDLDQQAGNVACTSARRTSCRDLHRGVDSLAVCWPLSSQNLSLMKRRSYFMAEIMTRCRSGGVESCRRCSIGLARARSRRLICRFQLAELQPERRCDCEGREPESVGSSSAKATFETSRVYSLLQERQGGF